MAQPLQNNAIGTDLEVIYTTVLDVGAVTAPSVGSTTNVTASVDTGLKISDGYIIYASIQFEDSTRFYPLQVIETQTSGSDGGEIKWSAYCYAGIANAGDTTITVYVSVSNFISTQYLSASKATVYLLRARGAA